MRKVRSWSSVGVLFLFFALPLWAQEPGDESPGRADPPVNFNAVAILRWYSANRTTRFPVGVGPFGVAFDGANIWVTNLTSNNVTKLQASDGRVLGTFAVGMNPDSVAFDGANIWVANTGSNTVSKL
jgi:DNA-binding beta-propeller fold protein YncE